MENEIAQWDMSELTLITNQGNGLFSNAIMRLTPEGKAKALQ